ncbi:MAG: response regulator [Flavobacterium sp.]|nr:MAG: response regulator [Flavobacterium sp.]
MKALIADDQELVLLFLEKCLSDMNIEVIKSHSITETINLYDQHLPDIVITDINMPVTHEDVLLNNHMIIDGKKTGLDIIDYIKNIRKDTIPVLVLSGNMDENIRSRSLAIGATDFIKKQIGYSDFIEKISQIIALKTNFLDVKNENYLGDRIVGVVVPCLLYVDRAKIIEYVNFIHKNASYYLCFLDDLSDKMYSRFLKDIKKQHRSRVSIYKCATKNGQSEGLRLAMLRLSQNHQIDYIGYLDKDLSVNLSQFNIMVEAIKKSRAKIVLGNPWCQLSKKGVEKNNYKMAGNIILKFISKVFGLQRYTPYNIPKVMLKDVIVNTFQSQFYSDFTFDLEIIIRVKKAYFYNNLKSLIFEEKI